MSTRYSKHLPALIFVSDLLILNIALNLSNYIIFHTYWPQFQSSLLLMVVNLTWIAVSLLTKSFDLKRPLVLRDNISGFSLTLIYHLLLVFGTIYFFKIYNVSRSEVIIGYLLFYVIILLDRSMLFFSLDYYRKKGYNHRQILIIGNKNVADRLIKSFSQHPEYGYDLTSFISDDEIGKTALATLINNILNNKPDEIFICYKETNTRLLKRLIRFGEENDIKIKVVSDLMLDSSYAQLINYNNIPVLQIKPGSEISLKIRILKRTFDIVFSSAVILFGSPFFIILYIITKATSRGPAFYKQERIGRNEEPFYIYKFRSMHVNAEKHGPQLSKDNDPRITKWGGIMRKTRFDEMPQFWNVLKGEMSVVGPRPERQHFIEKIVEINPNYKKLFCLKPGITSIGQVQYGYAENVDQMCSRVKYDLLYLQNVNLNFDLDIIYKTIQVVIQRKGK